jgi:hypothetical protein
VFWQQIARRAQAAIPALERVEGGGKITQG